MAQTRLFGNLDGKLRRRSGLVFKVDSHFSTESWARKAAINNVDALLFQANEALEARQFKRAESIAQSVLAQDPQNSNALFLLGVLYAQTNRLQLSEEALKTLLAKDPGHFDGLVWLAFVNQRLGEFDLAKPLFERALAINPNAFRPYVGLLRGTRVAESGQPLIQAAVDRFGSSSEFSDERRQLAYAIGKAYDDLQKFENAVPFFEAGNQIAAAIQKPGGMDRALHHSRIDLMMRGITSEVLEANRSIGSPDRTPIFILGMIRSGTSLVESIVSSHPAVAPGEELKFWMQHGLNTVDQASGRFKRSVAVDLIWEYSALLRRIGGNFPHVTDKMPLNYVMVGLIHLLFPNAPIIHCTRNPADTAVSIYTTPYVAPPDFAYDWSDIDYAFGEYRRVMNYWENILPARRMFELSYEALVEEPEPTIRSLIAYCGLEWSDACLAPQKNRRVVDTPSRWQVRQPIYKSSVGRAEHYKFWWPRLQKQNS